MSIVAILGGGISGLSCAHYLKTLGSSKIKYIFLLEKSPKFGGWIQTTRFPDGAVFEHGPRTIRSGTKAGYNALALADELALSSRVLPITREDNIAKNNFILVDNELLPLPKGLPSLIQTSKLLQNSPLFCLFKEFFCKGAKYEDETVYDFAKRRSNEHIAKFIIDPICRGIAAGDARELSIRSMFPSLYEAEKHHGSVIKGLIKENKYDLYKNFKSSRLVQESCSNIWRMWTLKSGLTELVDALACSVEEQGVTDLIFNAQCRSLEFHSDKTAEVLVENEKIKVDHVFSCIPSHELAPLVSHYSVLSQQLLSIPSVDVAVVYLEYEQDLLDYDGFGFLVPSSQDSKLLGITFDSCCFPILNGSNKTRLTCMMGGKWFKDIFGDSVSDDVLLETAVSEVSRHLGISHKPVRHRVLLQKKCIPQYLVGHHIKLEKMNEEIQKHQLCLSLLGASYKGLGVPDCIYNSRLAVEKYLNLSS